MLTLLLAGVAAQDPPNEIDGQKVYRVGSGVTAPKALKTPEPLYTEEARKKKIQGTVLLRVIVAPDGKAHYIEITRSLGYGLDEQAIASVKQWEFQPSELNGTPVPVLINIQVSFHLYDPNARPFSR